MIYSNDRKLALSGWLKQNSPKEYNTPLKLQKFLLLYEAFSKNAGEPHDFSHLRGYQRGPVFSNVWGDYTKERKDFNTKAEEKYSEDNQKINNERAEKCAFIVGSMSENELSDLTHQMNLWKAKEDRIKQGERQVDLEERDFDDSDCHMMTILEQMYPISMIENSEIREIDNHYFVFSKQDVNRLTEQHFDVLSNLAENVELHNPIYVEIDKEGRLLVD